MSENENQPGPATANEDYAQRLATVGQKRWKRLLNVQAPFKAHIRSLKLGRTLDVGCGTGRNLHYLDKGSVGVDHNPFSIQIARDAGLEAYTTGEFYGDPGVSATGAFDSLLTAHVIEHLEREDARVILRDYLRMVRPGGRVVMITPQERGHYTGLTHIVFSDFGELGRLTEDLGLELIKQYSFPLPRFTGKFFNYNEFVLIARKPSIAI